LLISFPGREFEIKYETLMICPENWAAMVSFQLNCKLQYVRIDRMVFTFLSATSAINRGACGDVRASFRAKMRYIRAGTHREDQAK